MASGADYMLLGVDQQQRRQPFLLQLPVETHRQLKALRPSRRPSMTDYIVEAIHRRLAEEAKAAG